MRNPFKFGKEVTGYQFYDRETIARELSRKLMDASSNIVLFAPRRYGKTSLVMRVLNDLSVKEGIRGMCFDMTRVTSLARFCETYVNAVYAMVGGRREWMHLLTEHLTSFRPELSINVAGGVRIRLDLAAGLTEMSIAEALDLPEKLSHDMGDIPLVVAFDEFQDVAELSKEFALEKIFRSCIQAHQNVRYVFLGSKTHLMKRMFADASRPFYNSATPLPLGKPPVAESREFLFTRFRDAGIELGVQELDRILEVSENIPYYLQELASAVFEVASPGQAVSATHLNQAIEDIVSKNSELYAERLAGLSESKRAIILALATEPTAVFSDGYRVTHALPVSSTLHTALKELQEDGIVNTEADGHRLADPFFRLYVRESPARVF